MRSSEYLAQARSVGVATSLLLRRQWSAPGSWGDKLAAAALVLAAGQSRVAELAEPYARTYIGSSSLEVAPSAFAGVAADGMPLTTLLVGAGAAAGLAGWVGDSKAAQAAREAAALHWLDMTARTEVADAGRASLRTTMAVRGAYATRVANAPCCGRCAVLHGRRYHWRTSFLRHPRCDCTMSLDQNYIPDEVPLDQIRGLSRADREAIELGADRSQVINAHRGMSSVTVRGQKIKVTSESTTKRGMHYGQGARLRPESILAKAKDEQDAIELLTRYGYIR